MLPRTDSGERELEMYRLLKQHACNSTIATMIDEFKIPHHRMNEGSDAYKVEFSVVVLPAMGPDLRRYYDESMLSLDDKKSASKTQFELWLTSIDCVECMEIYTLATSAYQRQKRS